MLNFVKDNPGKASLTIIDNGKAIIQYHADRKMPLASVAKILVAVEYAKQAAENKVKPEQMVSLDETNRYYMLKLDGDAQPQ